MSKCSCNTRIFNSFAARIQTLHETVHAKNTSGFKLYSTIRTLFVIKSLSRIVIRNFAKDWQEASCHLAPDAECASVLKKAAKIKEQIAEAHLTLCTLPSPFARWAGRRLTSPLMDWNDLVLDLSIATDPDIQNSLSELEEVL
ncbi:hypothetical protein [Maridesulfovibrio salexigens]|uniref:Uncharacterized protein n=1 Tax=Maridesulfovibrio salexigens (strain ATCC 14822 / DSM 2638 / NCIMB 8403 / VKM B-1763) TaxID=526222 RepID=C6BWJ6_MARSD|nr:hypothetical protein [Maridesulfovibrio salexigens]ACS80276.1 hypothetical protein Desal_2220 [Maridesulfovibrio salexigens DSM 2638]